LTEVMAAEAAHTENEGEAEAFLGAAFPISLRVMGAQHGLRPVAPALLKANAQLVQSLHRQGADGRQLLRVVPSVQRRAIASLKAARRAGHALTPALASGILAGQAAQVLGTAPVCGRALVRNITIRKGTVASPRW
jgi:hypothetical protein